MTIRATSFFVMVDGTKDFPVQPIFRIMEFAEHGHSVPLAERIGTERATSRDEYDGINQVLDQ